ncbi:MAG TPA: MFS transporter [Planctomycetota bacterium]|nr:MFS transporter [Planctomycetota bacterium]
MDLTTTPSRRRVLFALLYLAEGAPIGFLWWALPTLLRQAGTDIERISTLLFVLGLPWTLKVLGAPFVDVARSVGVSLRAIIAAAQVAMASTLALAARNAGLEDLDALQLLLVLHACAAALQDVAIDALCISVTPPAERGQVNGWMQFGYQIGRGAFGGSVLLWAVPFGPAVPWWGLVAVLLAVLVVVLACVPRHAGRARSARPFAELSGSLAAVLRLPVTWRALVFALVAAAGFEAVGAFAGPFLVDRGFDSETIGSWYELPKVAAYVLGGLSGGFIASRWGARAATLRFQVAFAVAVLLVAALDALGIGTRWPIVAALVGMYLAVGAFTVSSYALLMDLTAPRLAATQFSAYMGATNACESWSVLAIGGLVPAVGYATGFAVMAIVSLLALVLVPREPVSPVAAA